MREYIRNEPLFSIHIPKTAGTSIAHVLRTWFNSREFPQMHNHPSVAKILMPMQFDLLLQRFMECGFYTHYYNHYINMPPRRIPLGRKYGLLLRKSISECVHGHFEYAVDGGDIFHFYPRALQFITFLRDPLDMELSMYQYQKAMITKGAVYWTGERIVESTRYKNVDHWLEDRESYLLEYFPWGLSESNFNEVLHRHFIHIGVVEQLQRSVDILADKLGKPRIKVPRMNPTRRIEKPSNKTISAFMERRKLEYALYDFALKLNA